MLDLNLGEMEGKGGRFTTPAPNPAGLSVSPTYFKRVARDVASGVINFGSTIQLPKPRRGAAKLGLRFEAEVLKKLALNFTSRLATGVPLSFQEAPRGARYERPQTAIPDAFLLSATKRSLCIIEIKLRHSTDAWLQLSRFYLPIMRRILGDSFALRRLEICKYYDPDVRLPEEKKLILDANEVFDLSPDRYPVLIWER